MSLQYPIIIGNEPELCRLIRDIAREVVNEVKTPHYKPFLSLNDCYAIAQSEKLVREAIKNGNLKLAVKEGRQVVLRKDFLNWINNETPPRRYPSTKIRRKKIKSQAN